MNLALALDVECERGHEHCRMNISQVPAACDMIQVFPTQNLGSYQNEWKWQVWVSDYRGEKEKGHRAAWIVCSQHHLQLAWWYEEVIKQEIQEHEVTTAYYIRTEYRGRGPAIHDR